MTNNQKNKSNQKNNSKKGTVKKSTNKNSNSSKQKKVTVVANSKEIKKDSTQTNTFVMKTLVFLGVVIFCFILIYLMYHFFVEKSDIKINMSTDKQMEYITIEGEKELIMTQKFVSDLAYSMRYDISEFEVFKYKSQDIYKNLNDERVLVVVEKSTLPTNCTKVTSQTEYNNCYVKIDNYTEYYYVSLNNRVYKITIKTPGTTEYQEGAKTRISFMLNSFKMNN